MIRRATTMMVSAVLFLAAAGCDLVNINVDNPTGTPNLKKFSTEQEFLSYFNSQVEQNGERVAAPGGLLDFDDAAGDVSAAPPSGGGDGDAGAVAESEPVSGTTVQESGVDEADVVKSDGQFVYVLADNLLRIARITPADQLALTSTYTLDGYALDMYLRGDRVIAVTQTWGDLVFIDALPPSDADGDDGLTTSASSEPRPAADDTPTSDDGSTSDETETGDDVVDPIGPVEPGFAPFIYSRPQTIVTILDVTDRSAPALVSQTSFDGSQASSRMIDGTLYLVLANYQNYFYDVLPLTREQSAAPAAPQTTDVMPAFVRQTAAGVSESGNIMTWDDLYRPEDPEGFGIVSLISMDVEGAGEFNALGLVAEPGLIYSSTEALYVTNTQYDFSGTARETTDIYKFAYVDGGVEPVASGTVPGRVLNQYSMGEYQGYLRVATTVGPIFSEDGSSTASVNNVYVLGESAGALAVTGSVENIAPRESIQSARFIGDRGFVVTFEQIDPLFTLDLADPTNPRIVGELKVPGFSTFIVPMDDNHLLTVGTYIPDGEQRWPQGVQLSIFDVTDFANPTLAHQRVLTDENAGAWSESLYNPKAFTYFAEGDMVALPISIYDFGPISVDQPAVDDGDNAGDSTSSGAAEGGDDGVATETADDVEPPSDGGGSDGTDAVTEPWVPGGYEGLVVYHVTAAEGFQEMGRISTRFVDAGFYYPYFTRGVFVGDRVYAVTNFGIRGGVVSDMTAAPYELLLAEPVEYDPPVAIEPDAGEGMGSDPEAARR